ncbi:DivIVA domain-containing protein [Demequina sp.]|uniref:DivIVA domain-containing protein n=1 Tax=Demequina sp. TaxID=2050685 RepID=UPI003D1450F5
MALLTAEDVLNKAFSKTKYREGFDQDEVDDFLDEVANTIAQLTAERDELAARAANGAAPAAAAPATPAAEAPPVTSAGGVPGTTGLLAAATEPGAVNPTGMLAMAQKLHDEYVQAGEAERDRIVAEAHTAADEIRERADGDAKARMEELSGERADLEARIDDLRRFERDYRARLKTYLENLLGDLDHSGTAAAGAGVAAGFAASELANGDDPADEPDAGAEDGAGAETAEGGFDAVLVEDTIVADVYESEDGETEVVVIEEYETATPVSFDEALNGYGEPQADQGQATEFTPQAFEPVGEPEQSGDQPAGPEEEAPAAPPSYDASQSWESQLAPQTGAVPSAPTNPFAPVTQPAETEAAPASDGQAAEPSVAPAEEEPAPYTPPSSRMFNDLYGQQRPEQGN